MSAPARMRRIRLWLLIWVLLSRLHPAATSCASFWNRPKTAFPTALKFWMRIRESSPSYEALKGPVPTSGPPAPRSKTAACRKFDRVSERHFSSAWRERAIGRQAWRHFRTKVHWFLILRVVCTRRRSGLGHPMPFDCHLHMLLLTLSC